MWSPAFRPRHCAKIALFVLAVLANDARAATIVQTSSSQAQAPANARSSENCVSVAAGLAPCLTVDTPLSGLTTAEEAICCDSLLNFERGGCFCLGGGVSGWTAYDRRVGGLAAAYERCTAQSVSCPVSVITFEDSAPLRTERRSRVRTSSSLQSSKAGKGRHLNISVRDRGVSAALPDDIESVDPVVAVVAQDSRLSLTVGGISELSAALEGRSRAQVKVSLEVSVDVGESAGKSRRFEESSMGARLWSRAVAQPVLYGSLAVAVMAFVLLCLVRSRETREGGSQDSRAHDHVVSSCYCQSAKLQRE